MYFLQIIDSLSSTLSSAFVKSVLPLSFSVGRDVDLKSKILSFLTFVKLINSEPEKVQFSE